MSARLLSVNVGTPREFEHAGHAGKSAIWKAPVAGRVAVRGVNVEGDDQADRSVHGGPDKAVYAYASEDYEWWSAELDRLLAPGEFGENLTTVGIEVNDARPGERWAVGSAVLEVAGPRVPCWKLAHKLGDEHFPRRFTEALRPGAYLRIVAEGELGAGDEIQVVHRPSHDLTVRDVARIYGRDRGEAGRFLEVEELAADWREWAAKRAGRSD